MIQPDFFKTAVKSDKIVFGPSLMELGWEIMRWSGYIRWFKKEYPKKEVIVVTRDDRKDLYYGAVDGVMTIRINGDYSIYRPNMYRLDFYPKEKYDSIITKIKKEFPGHTLIEPPLTNNRNIFPINNMNFDYTPHLDNKKLANKLIKNNLNRIPIVLATRKRIDLKDVECDRNWIDSHWFKLFNMLIESKKYLVFIAGVSPSLILPPKDPCFVVLEKQIPSSNNITDIGLTIEIMRQSKVTIGIQSALPILSNILKTPTIMWGYDNKRLKTQENIFNTPCIFLDDPKFKISSEKIFKTLEENYV